MSAYGHKQALFLCYGAEACINKSFVVYCHEIPGKNGDSADGDSLQGESTLILAGIMDMVVKY